METDIHMRTSQSQTVFRKNLVSKRRMHTMNENILIIKDTIRNINILLINTFLISEAFSFSSHKTERRVIPNNNT